MNLTFKKYWPKYKLLILIAIIVLAGLVSYSNVYHNQFLWDDEFLIQENVFIRSFKNLPQIFSTPSGAGAGRLDNFYRPMQLTAYTLIYSLVGLKPWAFLLLNILLHLGNACLIFFLIRKIFKKTCLPAGRPACPVGRPACPVGRPACPVGRPACPVGRQDFLAFLTSLLWVVHPIHTEAVTYMSGIADPLLVFFGLSSFLCYLNFRQKKQAHLLIFSLILFILALFSKETIIILPGLFIVYELFFGEKRKSISSYRHIIWFIIIALGYFALRLTVLNFVNTLNLYQESNIYTEHLSVRIFTFLASLLMYYSFLFFPLNLHMERQFPVFASPLSPQVLISLVILIFLALVIYKNIKQKKFHLSFGILWFFIGFIPMSGIIPVNSFLLEHWLYFPSIGFFLCSGVIIHYFWQRYPQVRKVIIALLSVIVFILMSLTLKRNTDWKNPIVFYNDVLKYNQGTARVHNNLAMAYVDENHLEKAEEHYLKAIEMGDQYAQTHYNLARLYLITNQTNQAIDHLKRSIEINPNFFFSYQLLGNIYQQLGKQEKAQEYYQKAKEIKYY